MGDKETQSYIRTLAENEVIQQAEEEKSESEQKKIRQKMMEQRTYRRGKTARDRARGEAQRRAGNRAARVQWQHDSSGNKNARFPAETCNGKKNRYQVTGKGNQTVRLK